MIFLIRGNPPPTPSPWVRTHLFLHQPIFHQSPVSHNPLNRRRPTPPPPPSPPLHTLLPSLPQTRGLRPGFSPNPWDYSLHMIFPFRRLQDLTMLGHPSPITLSDLGCRPFANVPADCFLRMHPHYEPGFPVMGTTIVNSFTPFDCRDPVPV